MTDIAPEIAGDVSRTADAPFPAASSVASASRSQAFEDLLTAKRRTIAPMLIFSLGFFFGIMLLAGFARAFMAEKLIGSLNVGYGLVVGIYLVCWTVAIFYYLVATFYLDPLANRLLADQALRANVSERVTE